MKGKASFILVPAGILFGFFYGLFSAVSLADRQGWFSQKLYWLSLSEGVSRINLSTGIALALAVLLSILLFLLAWLWKTYFSRFLEVRLIKPIDQRSWARGTTTFALFSLSVFLFIQYVSHDIPMVPHVSGQTIILGSLCMILFSRRKEAHPKNPERPTVRNTSPLQKTAAFCILLLIAANSIHWTHKGFFNPRTPNVLLVVADTLRADHLSCYGYPRPTSPNIDRFAQEGVLFERHMSNAPWTKPSMGTIFTSLYPHEHLAFSWNDRLSDSSVTLAEIFLNRNYSTMAVQTNPCLSKEDNFSQGYQEYIELPLEQGEKVTDTLLSWIKHNKKKPFFAYVHFMDTHMPYNASEEFREIFQLDKSDPDGSLDLISLDIRILTELGMSLKDKQSVKALYDRAVLQFDRSFGRILQNLKRFNLMENTIIILTSDHGEEFWDHKSFGHGHTHYNEVLHVPLIIGNTSNFKPRRVPQYTQHLDVFPTILSLAGIKKTPFLEDQDKIPLLFREKKGGSHPIFIEGMLSGKEKRGVIKEKWKLIENTNQQCEGTGATLGDLDKFRGDRKAGKLELYNLAQDPYETTNLSSVYEDLSTELNTLILKKFSTEVRLTQHPASDIKKKMEGLKALGYIR